MMTCNPSLRHCEVRFVRRSNLLLIGAEIASQKTLAMTDRHESRFTRHLLWR
jgi:hypothetical protein